MTGDEGQKALEFKCGSCGAKLGFQPGAEQLQCPYCGHSEPIPQSKDQVVEHDFDSFVPDASNTGWGIERKRFDCRQCGAQTEVDPHITSFACAFCNSNQVVPQEHSVALHKPESLLPFEVDRKAVLERFRAWIRSLWFRPNALKKQASPQGMQGVYLPFWTYDSFTHSFWEGEAGTYYYEEDSEGNRERRVRWQLRSGTYEEFFDDVLIQGSPSVEAGLVRKLEPFDTTRLVPYKPEYLSGMAAEDYRSDMLACWPDAKSRMDAAIQSACSRLLGGDTQRGLMVQTSYLSKTYKLCLLPIWIASYRYQGKPYRYLVNGQTGRVAGTAPYSWVKITLAILALLCIVGVIAWLKGR